MALFISVEKAYQQSIWCCKILQGISQEALKKKIATEFIDSQKISEFMPTDSSNHIILVGSSIYWMSQTLEAINDLGLLPILITCQPFSTVFDISCAIPDYGTATADLIQYMSENGHDKIALFGINPDSSADVQKAASFTESRETLGYDSLGRSIFYNLGSMVDCFSKLFQKINDYNAIICANDFAAITAIEQLKAHGKNVPEDFFIASYTDTVIGRMYSPSITSVSLNFFDLGRQAVVNYSLLCKHSNVSSIKILAKYQLNVRKTTNHIPMKSKAGYHFAIDDHRTDFYGDNSISDILTVENLLGSCDEIDKNILYGLLTKEIYRDIATRCFISEETVKYRIRRFLTHCGYSSKKDLQELLIKYISPDSLLKV